MFLQVGAAPSPGFADPVGLLSDCHRRIERFLALMLASARAAAGEAELPAEAREALETARRYFTGMAPKHTADEEESLFPRLRARLASAGDTEADAVGVLAALEADHAELVAPHAAVDALTAELVTTGRLPAASQARLVTLLESLQATYAAHIAREDHEVFPLARRLLPAPELAAVGAEMAARRDALTCSQRKRA